ncbi:MAG: porin [Rubripirellula sp.]
MSNCGCEPVASCGCEAAADCGCEMMSVPASCGCEAAADCGCEMGGGFGCDSGCDSGCDCGGCPLGMECDLGDPFTLFGEHCGWSVGGWLQLGYHNKANSLFNSRPDEFQLHQAWLYAEKAIDTSCGFDIGGRIDYLYGTDSQDTQAFGTDPRGWDNSWDNGLDYGHALPQVYLEAGYGDLSVKLGHFYTIIGWEVVGATGNFFYSHAYTMYNSEPFTHTGALATLGLSDEISVWGGYTMGWDSGFDDNGDAFLGGVTLSVSDDVTIIYAATGGRFGEATIGTDERGYMHSLIADIALTDGLQYIIQSDLLDTHNASGTAVRETFGINQYLIANISDCFALGARFEWWNAEFGGTGDSDVYDLTLGANYKPHANVMVRPEIRWDWDDDLIAGLEGGQDQTTFGIDTIFTF